MITMDKKLIKKDKYWYNIHSIRKHKFDLGLLMISLKNSKFNATHS